jgi:hypothetical protein
MTGAGTAAERGFPDVGPLTMTEMVTNTRYIADWESHSQRIVSLTHSTSPAVPSRVAQRQLPPSVSHVTPASCHLDDVFAALSMGEKRGGAVSPTLRVCVSVVRCLAKACFSPPLPLGEGWGEGSPAA